MNDRYRMIYDLLAQELADDWQPFSIDINRLSYEERQQLKDRPEPDFIEKQLSAAQRGKKRAGIVVGIGLPLLFFLPLYFPSQTGWDLIANLLPVMAISLVMFGGLRHMHWCKREMIYRAFRLINDEHHTVFNDTASHVPASAR